MLMQASSSYNKWGNLYSTIIVEMNGWQGQNWHHQKIHSLWLSIDMLYISEQFIYKQVSKFEGEQVQGPGQTKIFTANVFL